MKIIDVLMNVLLVIMVVLLVFGLIINIALVNAWFVTAFNLCII